MTREVFEQRLAPLTSRQESSIAALVADYRKDLADVHSAAVRYSQTEGRVQQQALAVIAQLGETAVASLASTLGHKSQFPILPS